MVAEPVPGVGDELLGFVRKALLKRQDRIQRLLKPSVHVTHLPEADYVRKGEFSIPGGVLIAPGHAWAHVAPEGAVKVGLDDFAKKLLGPVDAIDFPNVGMTVKAGQTLFGVRQKHRRIQFNAPVSGRVVKTNAALAEDTEALEWTPYQRNWVCVIGKAATSSVSPGTTPGDLDDEGPIIQLLRYEGIFLRKDCGDSVESSPESI